MRQGKVVAACKTEILSTSDEFHLGKTLLEYLGWVIRTGIVHHKYLYITVILLANAFQQRAGKFRLVEINGNYGDQARPERICFFRHSRFE